MRRYKRQDTTGIRQRRTRGKTKDNDGEAVIIKREEMRRNKSSTGGREEGSRSLSLKKKGRKDMRLS
jgi:hypothetical protein